MAPTARLFDATDIRALLLVVADRLDATNVSARIYLLGGAAMALAYYDHGERTLTRDIDAWYVPGPEVDRVIQDVADERGLPSDWLNAGASQFVPAHGLPDGITYLTKGNVHIELAPAHLLLAMKLRAARPGRDDDDIAILVRRCGLRSVEEAQRVLDEVYDGEERFKPWAQLIVEAALGEYTVTTAIPPFTLPAVDASGSTP